MMLLLLLMFKLQQHELSNQCMSHCTADDFIYQCPCRHVFEPTILAPFYSCTDVDVCHMPLQGVHLYRARHISTCLPWHAQGSVSERGTGQLPATSSSGHGQQNREGSQRYGCSIGQCCMQWTARRHKSHECHRSAKALG